MLHPDWFRRPFRTSKRALEMSTWSGSASKMTRAGVARMAQYICDISVRVQESGIYATRDRSHIPHRLSPVGIASRHPFADGRLDQRSPVQSSVAGELLFTRVVSP